MKKNEMKHTTYKAIIKKMLVDELDSPEQQEKLLEDEMRINYDLCASDDEKIQYMYGLNKKWKLNTRKGLLTTRAYLLMMAYRHSHSRLREYANMFDKKVEGYMKAAAFHTYYWMHLKEECYKLDEIIRDKANK